MIRNSSFDGHQSATPVTPGYQPKKVHDCRRCGHAFVWVESRKSGKVYMAVVKPKLSQEFGHNPDVLRYYPFEVHRCRPEDVEQFEAIHGAPA